MSNKLAKVSWMSQANCKDADLKLFTSFDTADIETAKSFCKDCPVKEPCLLENFDTPWIAGGMTKYERLMRIWKRIENEEESNFAI